MPIRLTVISYKGSALPQALTAEFGQQGGNIGRKADNTLVLADPEQYLSGHHARITFDNGQYCLCDTSTNGSYLVNADINLNNASAILQDQEILRMGDYELKVDFIADPLPPNAPVLDVEPLFANPSSTPVDEAGPFSSASLPFQKPEFVQSPPASVFHDSFVIPPVLEMPESHDEKPAWLRDLDKLSQIDSSSTDVRPNSSVVPTPFIASPVADLVPTRTDQTAVEDYSRSIEFAALPVEPVQKPIVADVPKQPAPISASDSDLVRAFLQGAGIQDASFLTPDQWSTAMTSTGELFRCLIEGIMEVLRARAEMKSEFRVSVTTIRAVDNNPLKFNPDVESVLKLMLGPHNPAFMPASKAVTEAVRDIKQHQLAMTAGIQASLAAILKGLAPDTIEKGLGEGLVLQKKARCWELYCEKYPQMKSLAMEEFFGDAFVEAYEKQMRLLERH